MQRVPVAVFVALILQSCVLRVPQLGIGVPSNAPPRAEREATAPKAPVASAASAATAAAPQPQPLVLPPCPQQDPAPPPEWKKQAETLHNLYGSWNQDEGHWAKLVANPREVDVFRQYAFARDWVARVAPIAQPYLCSQRKGDQPSWQEQELLRVARGLDAFQRAAVANRERLEAPADAALAELDGTLKQCCQYLKGYEQLVQLNHPDSPLRKARRQAELYVVALESSYGADAEPARTRRERFEGMVGAIIDAGELPADKYRKADRAAVVKAVTDYATKVTKHQVLQVRLLGDDFSRKQGSRWVGNQLESYDEGFLSTYVIVSTESADVADVWSFRPRRNYLEGGKIDFGVWVPSTVGQVRPRVLAKRK